MQILNEQTPTCLFKFSFQSDLIKFDYLFFCHPIISTFPGGSTNLTGGYCTQKMIPKIWSLYPKLSSYIYDDSNCLNFWAKLGDALRTPPLLDPTDLCILEQSLWLKHSRTRFLPTCLEPDITRYYGFLSSF